jgi:hypothetical protein
MTDLKPQKRGGKIAMTPEEIDTFLARQRTCRVATVSPDGPHATPLWFAWVDGALWLYSLSRSQRWADLQRDPRIGVAIDDGEGFFELHGVEINGTTEVVGDVPVTGPVDGLAAVETEFARKYMDGGEMFHDGRHGWLKVTPTKISSWDFRKIA